MHSPELPRLLYQQFLGGDAVGGGDAEEVGAAGVGGEVEVGVEAGVGEVVEVAALGVVEVETGNDIVAVEMDFAGGGIGGEEGVACEGRGFSDRDRVRGGAAGTEGGRGNPAGAVLQAVADGGDAEDLEEIGVEVADLHEFVLHIEIVPLALRQVGGAEIDVVAVAVVDEGVPGEVYASRAVGGELEVLHLGAVGAGRHGGVDHDDGEDQGDHGGGMVIDALGESPLVGVGATILAGNAEFVPVAFPDGGPLDTADRVLKLVMYISPLAVYYIQLTGHKVMLGRKICSRDIGGCAIGIVCHIRAADIEGIGDGDGVFKIVFRHVGVMCIRVAPTAAKAIAISR